MCASIVSPAPLTHSGAPPGAGLALLIKDLSHARSIDEVMAVVAHAVRTLLKADGATFVLRQGDRCFYAEEDAISPLWKGQRFPMKACISGWCMLHGQAAAIPDIYKDARIPADAYRPTFVHSLAMAPIRRDAPLGALGAYWGEVREIQPDEIELLQAIADATALSAAYLDLRHARGKTQEPPPAPLPLRDARPPPAPTAFGASLNRLLTSGLRHNSPEAFAVAIGLVAVSTVARAAFEATGVAGLAPFSTYYPALLLATVIGGPGPGALAAVLGGLLAQWAFIAPTFVWSPLDAARLLNLALYALAATLIIAILQRYRHALGRFVREDARRISIAREAQHRSANLLSIVQSIVSQSLRDDPSQAKAINERILASQRHLDTSRYGSNGPAQLRAVLAAELAPFDLSRFSLQGDDEAPLPGELQSVLALVVHELATNAVKYGALSTSPGRVSVTWRLEGTMREIRWAELGGPAVTPPDRRGYGSVFLRRLVESVRGSIDLAYPPGGAIAVVRLPLQIR